MTVSQLWYNLEVTEADINWQSYKQSLEREKARAKENNTAMQTVSAPKYDPENAHFKDFIKTIALSTTAFFAFNPNNDVVRAAYAKANKVAPESVPKDNIPAEIQQEFQKIRSKMVADEQARPFFKRKTEGDASETGLIKFI